jgi:hypothetical protein
MTAWTNSAEIAHRAGADAVGLLRGLAAALQIADVVICELAQIMPAIADQDALENKTAFIPHSPDDAIIVSLFGQILLL